MAGRDITAAFPDKARRPRRDEPALEVRDVRLHPRHAPWTLAVHQRRDPRPRRPAGPGPARVPALALRRRLGPRDDPARRPAVRIRRPANALRTASSLIPEDRAVEGLHLNLPVRWNFAMATLGQARRGSASSSMGKPRRSSPRASVERDGDQEQLAVPARLGAQRRHAAEGGDREVHGDESGRAAVRRLDPGHRRADEVRVLRDAPRARARGRRVRPLLLRHRGAGRPLRSGRGLPRRRAGADARG